MTETSKNRKPPVSVYINIYYIEVFTRVTGAVCKYRYVTASWSIVS
jgi:hypothetical protein